jgi:hypothetical protein
MIGRITSAKLKDGMKEVNNKIASIQITLDELKESHKYIKKLLRKLEARKK